MTPCILPTTLAVDGVVELLRNHTFGLPWPNEKICITYENARWRLPASLIHLRESWVRSNANERIDNKVAIRSVIQTEGNQLKFSLQATTWDEVRPLHEAYSSLSSETRATIESGQLSAPNIGVVHVVACTTDGWIAMFCRNEASHYHPKNWSVTFEEGLAPEDAIDNDFFRRAARRGLAEEVAEELRALSLDCFNVMSVVLERALNNPAVIVLAELPFSREELPVQYPSDELASGSLNFLPITHADLLEALASKQGPNNGLWHPSSKFRLLVVLAKYFGEHAAAAAVGY